MTDFIVLAIVVFLGVATIAKGVSGFSTDGLHFGARGTIDGLAAKIIGSLLVLAGLWMFAWSVHLTWTELLSKPKNPVAVVPATRVKAPTSKEIADALATKDSSPIPDLSSAKSEELKRWEAASKHVISTAPRHAPPPTDNSTPPK